MTNPNDTPAYENVPLPNTPQALTAAQAAERTGHTLAYFRNIMSKLNSGGRDLRTPPAPGARARTYDLDKLDAWIAEGMPLPENPIPTPKPDAQTIHAAAAHNGTTWTITLEELGITTSAESLHAGQRTAHALAVQKTGLNPDEITIKTAYKLSTDAAAQWANAKAMEAEAKKATAQAAKMSREVVLALQAQGFSYADISQMLGITYQRAQQIARPTKG